MSFILGFFISMFVIILCFGNAFSLILFPGLPGFFSSLFHAQKSSSSRLDLYFLLYSDYTKVMFRLWAYLGVSKSYVFFCAFDFLCFFFAAVESLCFIFHFHFHFSFLFHTNLFFFAHRKAHLRPRFSFSVLKLH